jgi:hypothetical protein
LAITTFGVGLVDCTACTNAGFVARAFGEAHCDQRDAAGAVTTTASVDEVTLSPTRICLQIIRAAPMTDTALDTLLAETIAIWAPYNVIVSPIHTLSTPDVGEGEHRIKLVIRNPPANRADGRTPRGYRAVASITFTGATPGDIIYASLETASHLVEAARLDQFPSAVQERLTAQVLGRAIAHELGHYLLRSTSHSRTGLMRASFGTSDLVAPDRNAFRLEPPQMAALTGRVRTTSGKAVCSPGKD